MLEELGVIYQFLKNFPSEKEESIYIDKGTERTRLLLYKRDNSSPENMFALWILFLRYCFRSDLWIVL